MKPNLAKYIFSAIVLIILVTSFIMIYVDKNNTKVQLINNKNEMNITKEINIGVAGYDTINPVLTNNYDIQYLDKLIFNPLITVTEDFKTGNCLANECSKVGGKSYLIRLNQNLKWHNEEEIIAEDVKFTIDNLKKIDSIYSENVKNIESVKVIDKYTLKIYLELETGFFEYMLTIPILNRNCYEDGTLKSKTENPIGSGKYRIKSVLDNEIKLESEEGKINVKIYDEIKDLYLAFSKGEIDILNTKNIEFQKYTGTIGTTNNSSTDREYDYIAINTTDGVLKNVEVRKALNYFLDKKRIIYNIFNNMYSNIEFPMNKENYLYNQELFDSFDLNEGKKILLENNWKLKNNVWEKNGKRLEFYLLVNQNNKQRCKVAQEIKEQLLEKGVIINIVEASDYYYNQKIKQKSFQLVLIGKILPIYPSLETYLGEENISNYENKEIFQILNSIKDINNEEVLKEKYLRIEQICNDEMPIISLYVNNNFILYNSNIKGDFSHNWFNQYYNINSWYKIN